MNYNFANLDILFMILTFIVIVIIAVITTRGVKSTADYFTANRRFPWWMVAISYLVILLSAHDYLTYSQTGYLAGLTGMIVYLGACFAWTFLNVSIQTPVLYYGGYYTINEWIERRYDKSTRVASSIAVFIMMMSLMAFNFYVTGILINKLFGINPMLASMLAALFVTSYVVFGGVKTLMSVNIFEGILIFAMGLGLVFVGLHRAGGFFNVMSTLPSSYSTMFKSFSDESYPLLGTLFGIGLASNGAWFFCNQANLQKVLTARAMNHARIGTIIFGIILMPIGAIMTVWPGLITKSLELQGIMAVGDSSDSILRLAKSILGPGLWGLFIAALIAAMMSTADSYINSAATVFVNDIYKYWVPNKSDKHYLKISRWSSAIAGIGMTWLFLGVFARYDILMTALFSVFSAVMPGMLIVTIGGLLTNKIPARAATAAILSCIVGTFLAIYVPDTFLKPFVLLCGAPYPSAGAGLFNNLAGLVWALAGLLVFWQPSGIKPKEELIGALWNYPSTMMMKELYFHALRKGKRGIIDLTKNEIKEKISEVKQNKVAYDHKEEIDETLQAVERKIKVKDSTEKMIVYMNKETMKIIGAEENDLVMVQKGITGLSSAKGLAKEAAELKGKDVIILSRDIFEEGGFQEGKTVKIWKQTSWN